MEPIGGAVRARHMKSLLASVDRLPGGDAAKVRSCLAPALVQSIVDSTGPEWMPLAVNQQFTRSVHQALAPERFVAFYRAQALDILRSPLLRALLDGAVALFGLDPGSYLRFLPRGWDAIFHECGGWSKPSLVAPGHAEFELERLPPVMTADDVWVRAVAGSLSALVDVARSSGAAHLVAFDARAGRARYALRWSAAAADANG